VKGSTAEEPAEAVLDLLVAFIAVNRWTLEAACMSTLVGRRWRQAALFYENPLADGY
jgi:hypothetical protein